MNQEYEDSNPPSYNQDEAPSPENKKPDEEEEEQPPAGEQPPESEPVTEVESQPATTGDLLVTHVYPFVYLFREGSALKE